MMFMINHCIESCIIDDSQNSGANHIIFLANDVYDQPLMIP